MWERLKWNGWGEKGVQYELNQNGNVEHSRTGIELPKIIPFAKDIFGLDDLENTPSVELDDIELAEPRSNEGFVSLLKSFLSASQISFDKEQRICHAYGMSFRDLWRLRKGSSSRNQFSSLLIPLIIELLLLYSSTPGVITDAPDCVLYPQSHEDVERIVQAAHVHRAHLIPSGGRCVNLTRRVARPIYLFIYLFISIYLLIVAWLGAGRTSWARPRPSGSRTGSWPRST